MRFEKLPIPRPQTLRVQPNTSSKAKSLAICSTPEARKTVPYDTACSLKVLPLGLSRLSGVETLHVAVPIGSSLELRPKLKFTVGSEIKCIEMDSDLLQEAIQIAYRADDTWLAQGLESLSQMESKISSLGQVLDIEDSSPVPKALRTLLEYAIAKEASDIHLNPTRQGLKVKLRINGELLSHHAPLCAPDVGQRLISRIKVLAALRIDERSLPQDGSLSLQLPSGLRQIRVSILPTIHGERCVLRITSEVATRTLDSLGLSHQTLEILNDVFQRGSGLILLSGATGSGKTTTLYAMTQALVANNLSVCSVEDPVEAHIEGISQTSIATEKGLNYPNALRSVLRQDPDVILVGEIRDNESAKLVLSAALTGHLVLSTVHGSNIKESITRLTQMSLDLNSLSQVLKIAMHQSLVRRLCAKCKVINLSASRVYSFKVYQAVGCPQCEYSGFDGRLLVSERMSFHQSADLTDFMQFSTTENSHLRGYESSRESLRAYLEDGLILPENAAI